MPQLGKSVAVNKPIQGTTWSIVNITVSSKPLSGWRGQVVLNKDSGGSQENHPWDARANSEGGWHITGDGAMKSDGERVRSAETFPFSFDHKVNEAVRREIASLLDGKNGRIVVPPTVVKQPAPPPISPPAPARTPAPVIEQPVPPPKPILGNNGDSDHGPEIAEVLVSEISPFEGQPREEFTKAGLNAISGSLKQEGQKQLIVVTPLKGKPGKRWELVDGERRYRGAIAAGEKTLLALVRRYRDKEAQFWDSFCMNLNHEDHTPIEASRAVGRAVNGGKTVKQICVATGKSNCWVYQMLQLQKLDPSLQERMRLSVPRRERLPVEVAKLLSRLPDRTDQIRIWRDASLEPTRGLMQLKAESLAAQILDKMPKRGRERKPSDNAQRLHRIVRTAETDLAFVSKVTEADLKAFVSSPGATAASLLKRVRTIDDRWGALMNKLGRLA